MGAFISKQPNGLYCRFSTVVDCPTHWNMTAEDYIEYCAERAREEAREILENGLKPFENIPDMFIPINMTTEDFHKFLEETSKEVNK